MDRPQRRERLTSHPRSSSSSPRRRSTSSSSASSFLSKDPFGLLWFGLLFLAVIAFKWWIISPEGTESGNCVACVVFVIWLVTMLVFSLMTFFSIYWGQKFEKGTTYMFIMGMMCLICALIDYKLIQFVVRKLFYGGVLNWQETQATFLIDDFIPHSVAIALITAIFYTMIRIMVSKDIVDKNLVYTFGTILVLTTVPLFYLGVMLY